MSIFITILIALIVGALLFAAARYILEAAHVPQPFYNLVLALLIIIIALWIAQTAGLL